MKISQLCDFLIKKTHKYVVIMINFVLIVLTENNKNIKISIAGYKSS